MTSRHGIIALWILLIFATGLAAQEQEVAVPDGAAPPEDNSLKPGDLAPSWALMYAPGQFEFLKNWTIEEGKRLRLFSTQPDRHVVVLSFFATWCQPCMKELPHLQNLYEAYEGKKVKFFLIDITEATRNNPGFEDSPHAAEFLAKKGITIPILYDTRGVAKDRYRVSTLPRLFVIDQYQTIRLTKKGFHEGEDFEGELTHTIDELLTKRDGD